MPGDLVLVNIGDMVPADVRVTELKSVTIQVDEAPLTGESVPVDKFVKALNTKSNILQEQRNMLFSSTVCTYGKAVGIVTSTGMQTAIGRIWKEVQEAAGEEEDTPLKKKLN